MSPACLSSDDLFERLKKAGIFDDADTDVVGFVIEARVGETAKILVERRVDPRIGDALAATLYEFALREVPSD